MDEQSESRTVREALGDLIDEVFTLPPAAKAGMWAVKLNVMP